MKQIIPFKKELLFKTKVSEITSISLEHTLTLKQDDLISGEFHINGDYKMTEGSINREKFDFKLPFDIALDARYDMSSIIIDIDNFYYEIINNDSLQVNIDVYVEGEKIEETIPEESVATEEPTTIEEITPEETDIEVISEDERQELLSNEFEEALIEESRQLEPEHSLEEDVMPTFKDQTIEEPIEEVTRKTENINQTINFPAPEQSIIEAKKLVEMPNEFNLFDNIDNSDTYVTYHVYIAKEEDTLEKVLSKYEVTKEEVALYNNIEDVKPGTKLIIPSKNE